MTEFRKNLEELINRCSIESGSNTPDFILADFLADSLKAFDKAVNRRSEWYKSEQVLNPQLQTTLNFTKDQILICDDGESISICTYLADSIFDESARCYFLTGSEKGDVVAVLRTSLTPYTIEKFNELNKKYK